MSRRDRRARKKERREAKRDRDGADDYSVECLACGWSGMNSEAVPFASGTEFEEVGVTGCPRCGHIYAG